MMLYPEEFKKKVIKLYEANSEQLTEKQKEIIAYANKQLVDSLTTGDERIGKLLQDTSELQFSADDIIKAYKDNNFLKKLYEQALKCLEAKKLYEEYSRLITAYRLSELENTINQPKTR